MKRHRIFISSVQKEFAEERRLLAEYIRKDALLGVFFEVFLFEESEACDKTPQGVYLGEVEACDVYVGLYGQTFGYETESGVSATECEYDLATKLGKTRLVFIKDVEKREPKEARFIAKVQNDVTRKMFFDFDSLRLGVYSALVRYLEQSGYVRTTPFDASYDTGLTVNDVDDLKVAEFFKRARAAKKLTVPAEADTRWILEKLDAVSQDGRLSNAAVLLFAKEPQRKFIASEVKCLQYWGCEVERPIPSYRICHGGLIQMIEDALAFVMSRVDHEVGVPDRNGVARGRDELPELAVREAIVNAVCHRDYSDNGSVQVMLFRDRLEIINPGPLPKGWTVERLLKTHESKSRNLVLAQALNWAGYVEKSGNGTEAIVRRCIEEGLPPPEYHPDNVDFKTIIWRNPNRMGKMPEDGEGRVYGKAQSGPSQGPVRAQSGRSRGPVGAQSGPSRGPVGAQSKRQGVLTHRIASRESCVALLVSGEKGRKEIADGLGVSSKSGYFKRILSELVEDGLIERTIPDKPNSSQQRYRLTEKGRQVCG